MYVYVCAYIWHIDVYREKVIHIKHIYIYKHTHMHIYTYTYGADDEDDVFIAGKHFGSFRTHSWFLCIWYTKIPWLLYEILQQRSIFKSKLAKDTLFSFSWRKASENWLSSPLPLSWHDLWGPHWLPIPQPKLVGWEGHRVRWSPRRISQWSMCEMWALPLIIAKSGGKISIYPYSLKRWLKNKVGHGVTCVMKTAISKTDPKLLSERQKQKLPLCVYAFICVSHVLL